MHMTNKASAAGFLLLCMSMFLAGCVTNYPQKSDAELFLPLVTGYGENSGDDDFDYTRNSTAFRISKALEHQYIAASFEAPPKHSCSGKPVIGEPDPVTVRIIKILEPMDWQALDGNDGVFRDARGGILFGRGVALQGGALLSLRYVISPIDDERYQWTSQRTGLTVGIPFRYVELKEISLSQEALDLLSEPTKIYEEEQGGKSIGVLQDNEEIFISPGQKSKTLPGRVRITGVRQSNIMFSDGPTITPVRYSMPVERPGWIPVFNVSHFSDGQAYMDVVRSLTLAQAGDCDLAFSVFLEKIGPVQVVDKRTKVQVLAIIAHLHGQGGGDIKAVLDELAELEGETPLIVKYRQLNKESQDRLGG
jgi:hypothetical protein